MAADSATRLTERQLEVLELIAKGLTNAEIAGVLGIARATAKNHVSAVLQALDVSNRTEAVGLLEGMRGRETSEEDSVPGFGRRPAIVVLPFDDFGGDPDQRYFADGLVEDLTTRLASWRWFPVIARNSSFALRDRLPGMDVCEVGRELGARYVLEGSSRRSGDRVRVTAQLIDAESGQHVFAERYDRQAEDLFAIQDQIVEAIFAALAPALTRVERLRAARLPTPDLGAWECVQRGMHLYYRQLPSEIREARAFYERALSIDPGLALAWSATAWSHMADAMLGYAEDPLASIGEALAAARRAVSLDPDDASAHAALGGALGLMRQPQEARVSLRRALDLDPSSAFASFSYGLCVLALDTAEEAASSFARALRLSPRDPLIHDFEGALSVALHLAGRYQEAVAMARRSMTSQGEAGFSYEPLVAASLARMGQLDEAREAGRVLRERFPDASLEPVRIFVSDEVVDHLREGLRLAGIAI